jgi:hypothetical protein
MLCNLDQFCSSQYTLEDFDLDIIPQTIDLIDSRCINLALDTDIELRF